MNKLGLLIVTIALAKSTTGCLNKNTSNVKTLDNLENLRPLEFSQCSGNFNLHPSATALALPTHLQQAVQAVPEKLQQSFFEDLRGRIELSQNLAGICWPDESRRPAREDDVLGCVRQYGNPDRPLVIHLQSRSDDRNNAAKESYGLLLRFGFVLASQVQNRHITDSGQVTFWGALGGQSGQTNERIAMAFLADAGQRGKSAARAMEEFGLPTSITLAANDENREQQWRNLTPELRADFSTRVMAEAFHSRYCSAASRESMLTRYPRTNQLFEMVAADLEGRPHAIEGPSGNAKSVSNTDRGRSSSTWTGWYGTYNAAAQSRRIRGEDLGSVARTELARTIENDLGLSATGANSGQADRFRLAPKMAIDPMQLIGFLFQALNGLVPGGMNSLQGLLGGLGGGGGGMNPGFNPGMLPGGINPGFNPGILPGGINPPGNLPNAPIFPGILPGGSGNGGLTLPGNVDPEARTAFDKGNAYRQQNGLQPLQWSTIISTECNAQAQAQIAQGMNHWLVPHPNSSAENIAWGQTSGSEVATTWYNSEGHKRNLLGGYTQSAVGRAGGGSGNQWCQRFK